MALAKKAFDMEEMLARHKAEERELQAKATQLKKSVNKDKKRKKEVSDHITLLESDLHEKHNWEIKEFNDLNGLDEISKLENITLENGYEETGEDDDKLIKENVLKISKAEKRRQKKSVAAKEREEKIKEAEKLNKFSVRNIEAEKLKNILKQNNKKMFEINPDGNCMYAAIAHQIGLGATVTSLRSKAGAYIRDHADDFIPFITDAKTGEILTPTQFDDYCHLLENTPAWGGQPELRALSQALQRRIEVLQAEGSPIVFGEEFGIENGILLAYYRHYYDLGEHYNSVISIVSAENS